MSGLGGWTVWICVLWKATTKSQKEFDAYKTRAQVRGRGYDVKQSIISTPRLMHRPQIVLALQNV